jgi:hypothetical protein
MHPELFGNNLDDTYEEDNSLSGHHNDSNGERNDPVTFEAFRKFFDTDGIDTDPQSLFVAKKTRETPTSFGFHKPNPIKKRLSDPFADDREPREKLSPGSKKGHAKTRFTDHQRSVLLDNFQLCETLTKQQAKDLYVELAVRLNLPPKIVRIWFQNARSAKKKGNPAFQ